MSVFQVAIADRGVALPMNHYVVEQFLYDLGLDQPNAEYEIDLVNGSDFLLVLDSNFRELNRLAERISEMGDYNYESFNAWCDAQDLCTVNNALRASYHLDQIEFHLGFDTDEMLGEFALENSVFEEYDDLPEEVFAMLDRSKVGARMREQDGGVFVNGGYLIAGDISAEELPAEEPLPFFQARFSNGQEESTWFDLPLSEADEQIVFDAFSRDCIIECRSIIPQLSGIASGADELPELCDLDKALNGMDSEEAQKYKALLEAIQPGTPSAALRLANEIELFEVETRFADPAEYGRGIAEAAYDLDPNSPIFKHINFDSFGVELLRDDGYVSTRYGAVYRNAMAQQFLSGPNTVYSGDYYCGRTEGFPTILCWDQDAQKLWLELNSGTVDSELLADFARCQAICNGWGIRHCDSQEAFENILNELGAQPYDEVMAGDQGQGFGGMTMA